MRRLALLLALLALAPRAFGASAIKQLGWDRDAETSRKAVATDPRACARDPKCWRLVRLGFVELLPQYTHTIDAALPNQYFPGMVTFALPGVQRRGGHFLYVRCQDKKKRRVLCSAERDRLEERVVKAALVAALPTARPASELMGGAFELTAEGSAAFEGARAGRRDLWGELVELTKQALGETDGDLPKELR